MNYVRSIQLGTLGTSAIIFGPRMTGKTTLLGTLPAAASFNLLDPELELSYRSHPRRFWEEISAVAPGALIAIDEVQRVPALLNYVQMGMDQRNQRFMLSGSSARKLRSGGANLLGGRALDLRLHPLTAAELGTDFSIEQALHYGTLPRIATLLVEKDFAAAVGHLRSYITTYIREEIQAEALTRNVGAFHRFLEVAGQASGQIIEFANIARDCSVPSSTTKEYFQIIEDTMLGFLLWPFDRSERKKARPKFYLFDCGVARAIQNRLIDAPTPQERGFLFETWFVGEVRRINDYRGTSHELGFYREQSHEVDLLISRAGKPLLGIECKTGAADPSKQAIAAFQHRFPGVPLISASLTDTRPRTVAGIDILPWNMALQRYREV